MSIGRSGRRSMTRAATSSTAMLYDHIRPTNTQINERKDSCFPDDWPSPSLQRFPGLLQMGFSRRRTPSWNYGIRGLIPGLISAWKPLSNTELFWVHSFCSAFETVPLLCLPVTCRLRRLLPCFSLVEELFQASNFQCLLCYGVASTFGSFFEKMTLCRQTAGGPSRNNNMLRS